MCYQLPGSITFDGKDIRGGTDIDQSDYDFAASVYPKVGAPAVQDTVVAAGQSESQRGDERPAGDGDARCHGLDGLRDALAVATGEADDWDEADDVLATATS